MRTVSKIWKISQERITWFFVKVLICEGEALHLLYMMPSEPWRATKEDWTSCILQLVLGTNLSKVTISFLETVCTSLWFLSDIWTLFEFSLPNLKCSKSTAELKLFREQHNSGCLFNAQPLDSMFPVCSNSSSLCDSCIPPAVVWESLSLHSDSAQWMFK